MAFKCDLGNWNIAREANLEDVFHKSSIIKLWDKE